MLQTVFILAFWGLVITIAIRSEAPSFLLRMLSRIFASDRRRPTPEVVRGGGLADLPEGLARLVRTQRQLEAAIADLRDVSPAYRRALEADEGSLWDGRRRQAIQREFEDAVIHVTRSLDAWCVDFDDLDDRTRQQLHAAGPAPDVHALLRDFGWLPREVYQVGHLHFRTDTEWFEQRLFELDGQLREFEDALTHQRVRTYR